MKKKAEQQLDSIFCISEVMSEINDSSTDVKKFANKLLDI